MKANPARTRLLAWLGSVSAFAILALVAFSAKADPSESVVINHPFELKGEAGLQIQSPSTAPSSLEFLDLQVEPLKILDVVVPSLEIDGLGADLDGSLESPVVGDVEEAAEDGGLDLSGLGLDVNELDLPSLP